VQEAGFLEDLRSAIRVCRRHRWLPVVALVIGGMDGMAVILEPLGLIAAILWIPWAGIERLWYARAFTGGTLKGAEIPRLFLRLFGRFLRLLLLILVPFGSVILALALVSSDREERHLFWMGLVIVGAVFTFTLTFVFSALTFSTTRARSALRTGVGMIGSTWPASAPYAIVPALVPVPLTLMGALAPAGPWRVVLVLLGTILELLFVGATTLFFVRREMGLPIDGPRTSSEQD
jgi:hypothetical protein